MLRKLSDQLLESNLTCSKREHDLAPRLSALQRDMCLPARDNVLALELHGDLARKLERPEDADRERELDGALLQVSLRPSELLPAAAGQVRLDLVREVERLAVDRRVALRVVSE
jgi:hypothetical protein